MIISNNSYLVLGLDTDSNEKILNKRYKELLNLLNIDEVGSYDNEFSFLDYKKIRTEEKIKESFHNLSNQHKKLYQTFFRFQLVDNKDEECILDIVSGNYIEGSNKWLQVFEKTQKYHYLKNHIIGELLFYENKNKLKSLSFTKAPTSIVNLLHKLINSDRFWKEFKEIFNMQNEIPVRDDMIDSFKNEISQFIAERFFDMSEEIGNSKLYKEFSDKFGVSAKELDDNKSVTEGIKNIEDTLKSIKKMSLSDNLDEIIKGINEISGIIKKFDKFGLEDNPKIIKLKDDVSHEVRSMAIKLYNDHDDNDNAINFIGEAKQVAHSNNLKDKLNQDLKDMLKQGETTALFKNVIELTKQGTNYFSNKKYKSSYNIFDKIIKLVLDEISPKLNLDKRKLNLLLHKIEYSFDNIVYSELALNNLDAIKKMVNEDGGFSRGNDLNFSGLSGDQKLVIIFLIDSVSYRKISEIANQKNSGKNFGKSSGENEFGIPGWLIWLIIIIIMAIINNS